MVKEKKPGVFSNALYKLSEKTFQDEKECVESLVSKAELISKHHEEISENAIKHINNFKHWAEKDSSIIEEFFNEYPLSSQEGLAMMSLAEALPRITDSMTANALIHDKLVSTTWFGSDKKNTSSLVKWSKRGLQLASSILNLGGALSSLADPVVRESMRQALGKLAEHYVLGEDIRGAIKRAKTYEEKGYSFSYDMLGESARTEGQAEAFYQSYIDAIAALSEESDSNTDNEKMPGISVKLSALYPRYELIKREKIFGVLLPRLKEIVSTAKEHNINVTIDAEETSRVDICLEVFQEIFMDEEYSDYEGLGIAVQAYQKRAYEIIEHLITLAKAQNKKIPMRLVKGAYWDTEIKLAQEKGLENYAVFTKKEYTDVSYLACAILMLDNQEYIYSQFATHNAYTIAAIEYLTEETTPYEFQLLHGMGYGIYNQIVPDRNCRIYAPVGKHKELLPYLIRRLLENGANTSFLKMLYEEGISTEDMVLNPMAVSLVEELSTSSGIDVPGKMFGFERKNSQGFDLGNEAHLALIMSGIQRYAKKYWKAGSIINGLSFKHEARKVYRPYNMTEEVGEVIDATEEDVSAAIKMTYEAFSEWEATSVDVRAGALEKLADLLEENRFELISLCIREAGKTIEDSIDEIREAVDFCRYYASQARKKFHLPKDLPGPAGETNTLSLHGRGVFLCISPWNFPLAIFTGQVVAALVTGNTVIAKPAEQTSLIAYRTVELMIKAGIPKHVISLLPGDGPLIGNALLEDERLAGVVFTGSTDTARIIQAKLAEREGAILPFIAETGGQNAMIVDSSALLEHVLDDVLRSAFGSAGQRCSALRVLYIQEEVADEFYELLKGGIEELEVGNPERFSTDIGPVIDQEAKNNLEVHLVKMQGEGRLIAHAVLEEELEEQGHFIAPHAFEIDSMEQLSSEVFGPILHVIRYKSDQLDQVIEEINSTGYGLTLGVHSRIESRAEYIQKRVRAGNIYVNRNMTGAVVGVQPFGGEGLSGTGPKAGGPNYLNRFVTERTYTVNTAAIGGDVELLS